jgi:predicted nucleic acid-binding protein
MNIFCDTSVIVASALKFHPHHPAAFSALSSLRVSSNRGYTSAHALVEAFFCPFSNADNAKTIDRTRPSNPRDERNS